MAFDLELTTVHRGAVLYYYYYWCDTQERSIHFSTSTGQLHYLVRSLQLHSATAVSPTWTTSHSWNILKVQRDTKGPTLKCLLTTNKKSHRRCSRCNRYLLAIKVTAWEIFGPRLPISKTYIWVGYKCNCTAWIWPQCQLNSWELLYGESQIRTQNAVKDKKTGNSFKTTGQTISNTNKHEDLNCMFANHGKRTDYTLLLQ